MSQQLIDLTILNSILGLPKNNRLQSTLLVLNDLVIFKNKNKHLKSMMTRLQQQLTRFKIKVTKEINQHIQKKIQILKQEIKQQSLNPYKLQNDVQDHISQNMYEDKRKLLKFDYQSIEKYMQEEFNFKIKRIQQRQSKFQVKRIEDMSMTLNSENHIKNLLNQAEDGIKFEQTSNKLGLSKRLNFQ